MATTTLAVRVSGQNPDHHLWNNNGTWWCHYTLHRPDFTKQRVRESLRTADIQWARRMRDARFSQIAAGRSGRRDGVLGRSMRAARRVHQQEVR